jgi:hypothetical protein
MHSNPDTAPAIHVESTTPASGLAATKEIAERLAGALAELQAVQVMLQERLENLARREAELAGVQAQIDQQTRTQHQRHLEMEERQHQLDEQSGELALRRQELEVLAGDLTQRQEAVATAQEELQARAQQLDSHRAALEARESQLEQRAAEIERRAAELEARQAELVERESELAAGRAELAQWREALDAECSRMAAEQEALERLRIELESREEELLAEQAMLERRHQALVRFQQAFSEVAATLDLATAGTSPDDPHLAARTPAGIEEPVAFELGAVDPKARSSAAGGLPDVQHPAAHAEESDAEAGSTPRGEAGSALGTDPGPTGPPAAPPPPESGPPRVRENCGAGEPSPGHDVDESKLDPQELLRLRVLRRLTGGKLPDAQLLERIRQERATATATESAPGRKGWRRWWS